MAKGNIEAIYRLSPLQEGILYHTLESPKSGVYFQQFSCTLQNMVDTAQWERAWCRVAQRHPVMRTFFTWEKRDKPLQIVREQVTLPWEYLDWREWSSEEQHARWQSLLQRDRDRGFDISSVPLMRFTMVQVGKDVYRFIWSFHHILLDGWSQRLILDEVTACYANRHHDHEFDHQAPPYSDFIGWLEGVDQQQARLFWTQYLKGMNRPTDPASIGITPENQAQKTQPRVAALSMASSTMAQLADTARKQNITLNSVIVGAWALVLSVHGRSSDVMFGTTVSGRPVELASANKMAGLFINTLPFRVQVPATSSVAEWLRDVQSNHVRLREFEQTALVDIQRWSEIKAGTPLFETIVVFENMPERAVSDTSNDPLVIDQAEYSEFSHYPLAILVDPGEGLKLIAVYQPERIQEERVRRLLEQLQLVLEQMSGSLETAVGDLSLLTEQQRALSMIEWNRTGAAFPDRCCIHDLIEQNAENYPERIAIIDSSGELSFRDLNNRANQLARYLQQQGVGERSLVPVLMQRNAEAIIALLAILKTGAAYIPLDEGYSSTRIAHVVDDLAEQLPLVLTQESLLEKLVGHRVRAICVDRQQADIKRFQQHNLQLTMAPTQLAYVVYTSGSTGRPKGVMVEHGSLVNSTRARVDYYPEHPRVFCLLSSFATDSSVAGIYWSLCYGSTLLLANRRVEQDVQALGDLLARHEVSHVLCIPSLYQLILENCRANQLASLKTVIVAGEACTPSVIRQHQARLPGTDLYNEYGPSECTVWATVSRLTDWQPGQAISIGGPVANTQLYVLDASMRPLPIGVAGELYIGGKGVARGYLNQPELTDAAFVANPFGSDFEDSTSSRLYKTGDLVRYLDSGQLEFLGRVDNQIKLRGYRVEPEEIEKNLVQHSSVDDVCVFLDVEAPTEPDVERLSEQLLLLGSDAADRLLREVEQMSDDEIMGVRHS